MSADDGLSESDFGFSEVATDLNEEFYRLRWSVFEELSEIRVADDPDSIAPELSPFLGHPIALEAATEHPLHEIAFCSDDLQDFEAADFRAPKPVIVRRADGGVITIGDVVEQLSRYFITHKDIILETKAPSLQFTHEIGSGEQVVGIPAYDDTPAPPDTKVVFEGFDGGVSAGHSAVHVQLWADGQEGKSLEYFWKSRADPNQFPI
jgi:hypothetical protein